MRTRMVASKKTNGVTREIALTQGKKTLVDASLFASLSRYCWFAHNQHGRWYARRFVGRIAGKQVYIEMGRHILAPRDGMIADHANLDSLDNRRANLRAVTKGQNNRNTARRSAYSGLRGVYPVPTSRRNPWRAQIQVNGKPIHVGVFNSPIAAAHAHDAAARTHFGEFAVLNFPEGKAA